MSTFTPEQQAELDAAIAKAKTDIKAEYDARGTALRAWINAHPLAAARVIGTVCLLAGIGGTLLVQYLRALVA